MLPCEIQKGRQHMGSWGTVVLWFYIWLQRFNVCFFLYCLDSEWLSAHPSINCSCGSKNPPAELLLHFFSPYNWVMRMQKMWSHLGKQWCKHKVSPGRQRRGRGDDKARHCHCWDGFRAEKCFWNAYVNPCPLLFVWELTSILLQQRFPISWNKIKRAFMGALPFKSTHFPVKMKVSHKLHLWFPQDFSLALFWQFKTPLIFEQGLSLCTSDLDYGLWQW